MPITHQHARRFMGQPVMVHLHDGSRCCGILRHVNGEGFFVEPMRGVRTVSTGGESFDVTTADRAIEHSADVQVETVQFGWWFFPFFAAAALFPFLWW